MLIFSDEQTIYGSFRAAVKIAGADDDNMLHTVKNSLISTALPFHILRYMLMGLGGILCITLIGIPVGLLLIGIGVFFHVKYKAFLVKIEAAYTKYRSERGNQQN